MQQILGKIWAIVWVVFLIFQGSMKGFAEPPTYSDDIQRYRDFLKSVNQELEKIKEAGFCPGVKLAITCGNGICETDQGENENSCPADCANIPLKSYNLQTLCKDVKGIYSPKTIEEAQSLIRKASDEGWNIRVIGRAHTANTQLCTNGVIISTENLNHILGIERYEGSDTVWVEPGVTLGELAEWLDKRGLSLGYATTQFAGTTIAGAVATASHGSSGRHSALVSSLVKSLKVIGPSGEISEYSEKNSGSEAFKALRANLGNLGMVVGLKLGIIKQFNLHMHLEYGNEADLFKKSPGLAKECDYYQIHWFPHHGSYASVCGRETTQSADEGAANVLLNPAIPEFVVKPFKGVLHYGACYSKLNCLLEDLRYATLKVLPPLQKIENGKAVNVKDVIGPSHRMITSVLSPYQKGMSIRNWEIAVPYSKLHLALKRIQEELAKGPSCMPLTGISVRFVKSEDTTLIGHTVAQGAFEMGEPVALIESIAYFPMGFPPEQVEAYLQPYRDTIKILLKEFAGRAHWGKNEEWIFDLQKETKTYGPLLEQFKEVMKNLDRKGIFLNMFGRSML